MPDKAAGQFGNVHKPILMNTDVDKRAEVDHIAHRAAQLHAGLEIVHIEHVALQDRRRQILARIAPRLDQFVDDVPQRRLADAQRFSQTGQADLLRAFAQFRRRTAAHVLRAVAQPFDQSPRGGVGFRMHRGGVQHVL